MKVVKCVVLTLACLGAAPFSQADAYDDLFKASGWPVQVDHFDAAVQAMQNQYKDMLPAMLYQTVVAFTSQRFSPSVMKQQGLDTLKTSLADPDPALVFFDSDLGKKVVKAETDATAPETLQQNQKGVPSLKISDERRALFKQLAGAIPYRQATVDVSVSLSSVVGDTVEGLFPGMGFGDTVKQVTPSKAQIEQQVDAHLEDILVYVYRDLTDQELQQFITFAKSTQGQAYYQSAKEIIMTSVNK